MPQLARGGKHVFGWSRVGSGGRIAVPPEAVREYGIQEGERLVLLPGSRTSGGFILGSRERVARSPLGGFLEAFPGFSDGEVAEGEIVEYRGKPFAWTRMNSGGIEVPAQTLARFGVRPGDRLLAVRGSGLAVSLIVRGPIVELARTHPELKTFEE